MSTSHVAAGDGPVRLAVVGAGDRGSGYARWALEHPDRVEVVALAEPDPVRARRLADELGLGPEAVVDDWRTLVGRGRVADAVVIATQDAMHREPALAFVEAGYDVLLEKPMAPTEEECVEIATAATRAGVIFAVCHVLLYTPYTRALVDVVRSGRLGDLVSVQHLEPVGYWHQAHSFVRGNWRNEAESNPMLMAKACHDLDWLQHVLGEPAARVSSFGGLRHFTADNRPEGAADRCVDCSLQHVCPYSATEFYGGLLREGALGWPLSTVLEDPTPETLDEALTTGPYGRCVYACDNDVVDHQVVSLEFVSGATGTFTMTAFNEPGRRQTKIFGTHGELQGDGEEIRVREFGPSRGSSRTEVIEVAARGDATSGGGHGGGDGGLMDAFATAVSSRDPSGLHSGVEASLASHRTVFAAERARHAGTVEVLDPLGAR